jgi:hypothetical protein
MSLSISVKLIMYLVLLCILGSMSEPKLPQLWQEDLWDDVLDMRAARGMHFSMPDISRCLIFQKLQVLFYQLYSSIFAMHYNLYLIMQMLQICILCENEETTTAHYRHLNSDPQGATVLEQPDDSVPKRILDVTSAYNYSFSGGTYNRDD